MSLRDSQTASEGASTPPRVFAGIVAFHPRFERLIAEALSIQSYGAQVCIFANSPFSPDQQRRLGEANLIFVQAPNNLGVAAAHNQLAERAISEAAEYLLLLDDDSYLSETDVGALVNAHIELRKVGQAPAVVGPCVAAPAHEGVRYQSPRYFQLGAEVAGCAPVQFLISSGMLIDLKAFADIGPFRGDFFIDHVDTEWCFRAKAKGYSIWRIPNATMRHTIGRGVIASSLGPRIARHSAYRRYAYVRNLVTTIRSPFVSWSWKARFGMHLLRYGLVTTMHERREGWNVAKSLRAVKDGWSGRMGPPVGLPEGEIRESST